MERMSLAQPFNIRTHQPTLQYLETNCILFALVKYFPFPNPFSNIVLKSESKSTQIPFVSSINENGDDVASPVSIRTFIFHMCERCSIIKHEHKSIDKYIGS